MAILSRGPSELVLELGTADQVKEDFFDIYHAGSKDEAQARAIAWAKSILAAVAQEFKVLQTALHNWWREIFVWYDYRVSNAFTESVN